MKIRFKIFWSKLKRRIKNSVGATSLTPSGECLLNYLKKKIAGEINADNEIIHYERQIENFIHTVAKSLIEVGYVITDSDKRIIMEQMITELEYIKKERKMKVNG